MLRRLGGRGMDSNWFRIYPAQPCAALLRHTKSVHGAIERIYSVEE